MSDSCCLIAESATLGPSPPEGPPQGMRSHEKTCDGIYLGRVRRLSRRTGRDSGDGETFDGRRSRKRNRWSRRYSMTSAPPASRTSSTISGAPGERSGPVQAHVGRLKAIMRVEGALDPPVREMIYICGVDCEQLRQLHPFAYGGGPGARHDRCASRHRDANSGRCGV